MKREDFICTIGFQGGVAIVDGSARKQFGRQKASTLLESGMYRLAYCAALYDNELDSFLPAFRTKSGVEVDTVAGLQRLFGVFGVPEEDPKVQIIG